MDLIPQRVIDFGPWWFWLIALIAAALAVWRITASRTKNTDKAKDVALQGTLDSPPRIK